MLVLPLLLTACINDDSATQGGTTQLVGRWTADVTGATQTLWGDGKALRTTELASDGTGSTDIYYLLNEDIAVAHSHQTFRYTASADGQLTMTMDGSQTTETATWSVADGQLTLQTDDQPLTLQKTDAATEKKMAEWNAAKLINVPAPARYTVFVYGNAGGDMDNIIEEGLWERLQPLLTDQSNVRVICFYKYGEKTNSKYDYDGDNSNGMFQPQFDVIGPVKIDRSQYFAEQTNNGYVLAYEAVEAAATAALTALGTTSCMGQGPIML